MAYRISAIQRTLGDLQGVFDLLPLDFSREGFFDLLVQRLTRFQLTYRASGGLSSMPEPFLILESLVEARSGVTVHVNGLVNRY